MRKFLIFVMIFWAAIVNVGAMMLCEKLAPESCAVPSHPYYINYGAISGCTGGNYMGSPVSTFEVWGGCATNPGTWGEIYIPTSITYALSASGSQRYCHCQIKSINGIAVPASNYWVFVDTFPTSYDAASCRTGCGAYCSGDRSANHLTFRTNLFNAMEM